MFASNAQAASRRHISYQPIGLGIAESGFVCAAIAVRPDETAVFRRFLNDLEDHIGPKTALEGHFFNQLSQALWNLTRLFAEETRLIATSPDLFGDHDDTRRLERLVRHKRQLEFSFQRALRQLRSLQKPERDPAIAAAGDPR